MASTGQSATAGASGESSDIKKEDSHIKFLQAVRDGDDAKVNSKLKNKIILEFELNKQDVNNLTAVQYAVLCNKPRVLQTLIRYGADIRVTDSNGLSLAHHAAKITSQHHEGRGHRNSLGVSIEGSEQPREPVEQETCCCLSVLINRDPSLMWTTDPDGQTPMHYAVMSGNIELVQLLHDKDMGNGKNLIYVTDNNSMAPLHVAASYGQYKIAEYLLQNDAQYLMRDKYRNTPLHYTCAAGNKQMTRLLLDKAAPENLKEFIEAKDSADNTCLHLAAENGHVDVVQELIDKDASVMVKRKDGMFPLHLAIIAGKLEIVVKLSNKMKNFSIENNAESTPLHIAAKYNRLDIAKYILEKQDEVLHKRDKDGNTPLHNAAFNDNADMVKLLITYGADIHAKNINGRIPLHLAAERGHVKTFEELLTPHGKGTVDHIHMDDTKKKMIEDRMRLLSQSDDPRKIDEHIEMIATELQSGLQDFVQEETKFRHIVKVVMLAQKWTNVSAKMDKIMDIDGSNIQKQSPTNVSTSLQEKIEVSTPLQERIESLPKVLYAHTVINTEDQEVNTPLHLAARGGHVALVERILKGYFVEPNRKNDDERTPLHLVALHGRPKTAEMIISVSQNAVFAEDQKGNTPLHLAAQARHKGMLDLLIKHKADIHHKNLSGRTALDLAAATGWEEACSLLVKIEAQSGLKYKDENDKSPLYLACEHGHVRVAGLLLENNADVTAKSGPEPMKDWNCLDVAVEKGHRDIAQLIIRSPQWRAALQNRSMPEGKASEYHEQRKRIETPMRRLIRNMPDVALEVMDKCRYDLGKTTKYDYQYIDDLYEDWTLTVEEQDDLNRKRIAYQESKGESKNWKFMNSYTDKAKYIKKNHPLMIMVKNERDELLQHDMVIRLIKQKWFKFGAYYYLASLLVHLFFLILLTRAVVQNKPPHLYSEQEVDDIKAGHCDALIKGTFLSDWLRPEKYIMYALMIIGAIIEFTQIYTARSAYFTSLESYVEWVVYILSFLYLLDFNHCTLRTGYREHWQWSLGAFAVFFSWVDLILYLKAFTSLGLYVIMFELVCWTFLRVFVVFFSLIGAFALGFHILLQNQICMAFVMEVCVWYAIKMTTLADLVEKRQRIPQNVFRKLVHSFLRRCRAQWSWTPFRDVANSILRSSVMFLGELDYNGIFNEGVNITGQDDNLRYPAATSVMFSAFILLACIVLMNLLVGLAVDDIKGITRKATFRRTSMHVDLVLDVEKILLENIRRAVYRARKEEICKQKEQKKQKGLKPWTWFLSLGIWWWNQTMEQDENVVLKQIPELIKKQEELHRSLEQVKDLLKQNQSRVEDE